MTTMFEQFDALITKQQELRKEFQETAQELFKETTKEFFDINPGITAVVWTQYTPYFNDGDECIFAVNSPTFTNAPKEDLDYINYGEYDGENESVWAADNLQYVMECDRDYWKETKEKILSGGAIDINSCQTLEKMLGSGEMDDIMREMFGDHVKVILTRDGIEIEDYDHE
jgi:hypothetical protein